MGLHSDFQSFTRVVRRTRARRRAYREWHRARTADDVGRAETIDAVLYFADTRVNLYQVRQWFEPLAELDATFRVAIVTRSIMTAVELRRMSPLPVVWMRRIVDVEAWLEHQDVKAVFYVNQNMKNFQMLRFRDPVHIHLSHGESEKDSMTSNQLKAYDYAFIAGQAARDRILARVRDYDVDARTIEIGRPQVDVIRRPPRTLPADGRTVVLYAPTWEGDRPTMSYSSLWSHGPELVKALIATGSHRIIFRPHPRTGVADASYGEAKREIVALLDEANAADPTAQHVADTGSAFGWQLHAADACIADISAVTFDWLPTGKPLLVTRPTSDGADIPEAGLTAVLPLLDAAQASNIVKELAAADSAEQRTTRANLTRHYFGDTSPGASMHRWLAAVHTVIARRATQPDLGPEPESGQGED